MGVVFSAIGLFVFDFVRPGWRDELCGAVSFLGDSCECTVGPNPAVFSFAITAEVTTTCPIGSDLSAFFPGSSCVFFSNGQYCWEDCVGVINGIASLDLNLDFTATMNCGLDKRVDFINDGEPVPEFDFGGGSIAGSADSSGSVQLDSCGPAELFLSELPVGNCSCDLAGCGVGLASLRCDAIGDWPGFDSCFSTTSIMI